MSTRRYESREEAPSERSRCMSCLCVSWKVFTCIFSHVTLIAMVVAYCILGAVTFEHLESANEKLVKKSIKAIRDDTTERIWQQTNRMDFLKMENWTQETIKHLEVFEAKILKAMKEDGWDGYEEEDRLQWTISGSLFYSIIVITTIGYGHIAPKTMQGKIATIFYAILGIPLMLLCLSNIGDIMASSFRFLYWRVCCYVCTREPKKHRRRMARREMVLRQQQQQQFALPAPPGRYPTRPINPASMRRSIRTSQRSADSGFDPYYDPGMSHAYSDMDCRYAGANGGINNNPEQQLYYDEREKSRGSRMNRGPPPSSPRYGTDPRYRNGYRGDRHTVDRERFPKYQAPEDFPEYPDVDDVERSVHASRRDRLRERDVNNPTSSPQQNRHLMRHSEDRQMGGSPRNYQRSSAAMRVHSLDRRMMRRDPVIIDFEQEPPCKAPIYANKYALDDMDEQGARRGDVKRPQNFRSQSMPRQSRYGDRLLPPGRGASENRSSLDENEMEMQPVKKGRTRQRPVPAPSPRIMSPMGFAVHRQARHVASVMDENSLYDEDGDRFSEGQPLFIRPVPIWLCVFLVVGYIIGGAFLFRAWEEWPLLDAAYFCFITLTTIGFGDFVPAQGEKENPNMSIALCSLYLLFGIALLAMSFNLVQEEVITKVKNVARRLGIIKDDEIED